MRRKRWIPLPAILAAMAVATVALNGSIPPNFPRTPAVPPEQKASVITYVRPADVFPGDFATVYGFNLEATQVRELWLLNGKEAFRVEIMEQDVHTIVIRLPNWIPTGRWQIAFLGKNELLIEQGVYLTVRPYPGFPTG